MQCQAAGRSVFIRAFIIAVFLASLLFSFFQVIRGNTNQPFPVGVSDMIVVDDGKGNSWIYLADEASGAIWRVQLPADLKGLESFNFKDFSLVSKLVDYPSPGALAYSDGKLIVCDSQVPALYTIDVGLTIDPGSVKPTVIAKREPLREPESVAISETGVIAVGDDGLDGIILFAPGAEPRKINHLIAEPVRIAFEEDRVLALDEDSGLIHEIATTAAGKLDSNKTTVHFPAEAKITAPKIKDFSFHRGIFYLSDSEKKRIVVFAETSSNQSGTQEEEKASAPKFFEYSIPEPYYKITATENYLFAADVGNRKVVKLQRPVPSSVVFEMGSSPKLEETYSLHQATQAALYNYFDGLKLLPKSEVEIEGKYENIEHLLVDKGMMIRDLTVKDLKSNAQLSNEKVKARNAWTSLICKLNNLPCAAKGTDAAVHKRKKLILPQVHINLDRATILLYLAKQTAREKLDELLVPEQQSSVTAEYLQRLNADPLESLLNQRNFIYANPPSKDLQPTSVVKFQARDEKVAELSQCGSELRGAIESVSYSSPYRLSSNKVWQNLPRQTVTSAGKADLPDLGVEGLEVQFDSPASVERVNIKSLRGALTEAAKACQEKLAGGNAYVVLEAWKVSGARYKLLPKMNEKTRVRKITRQEIEQWGLIGEPDETGQWSLVVKEPFYIGYRVIKVEAADTETWKVLSRSSQVRPNLDQEIFNEKQRVLKLPYTRWNLNLFLYAEDINNKSSELYKIAPQASGVLIYSNERGRSRNASATDGEDPCSDAGSPDLMIVTQNRNLLKERLHYLKVDRTPPKIGILEQKEPDYLHPDFVDALGDSVWWELKEEGILSPRFERNNEEPGDDAPPSLKTRKYNDECFTSEHATHVSGILAARQKSSAPGLLPSSQLVYISTDAPGTLPKALPQYVNDVKIFSVSQKMADGTSLNPLKIKMGRPQDSSNDADVIAGEWLDLLFIVAAGNDKIDLNNETVLPAFVGWWPKVENVIVVGASDVNGDRWIEKDPATGEERGGSNYGKKYVHLFAPGVNIFSTASDKSYAPASGTSQAVPQVTAAAAMIYAQQVKEPNLIKARLIYTADFVPNFHRGKVLGGVLNVGRAVSLLDQSYFTKDNEPDKAYFINRFDSPLIMVGGVFDSPTGGTSNTRTTIGFDRVLRIQNLHDGTFRVIYLEKDTSKLKILMRTTFETQGTVKCNTIEKRDLKLPLESEPETRIDCRARDSVYKNGVKITDFDNYIGKLPLKVSFAVD